MGNGEVCISVEHAKRIDEMLEIAAEYIETSKPTKHIHYDDAMCDGYCVADDCRSIKIGGFND